MHLFLSDLLPDAGRGMKEKCSFLYFREKGLRKLTTIFLKSDDNFHGNFSLREKVIFCDNMNFSQKRTLFAKCFRYHEKFLFCDNQTKPQH
jgi:hypothetical protein